VSVVAQRATTADALSTACAVSPAVTTTDLLREGDAWALFVAADGSRRWLGA
jgi:thiamine biosynthesis lipoprotein ApbE